MMSGLTSMSYWSVAVGQGSKIVLERLKALIASATLGEGDREGGRGRKRKMKGIKMLWTGRVGGGAAKDERRDFFVAHVV